ncbi:MAG: M14 family metallopeptidase [Burkholderiales bacterium]
MIEVTETFSESYARARVRFLEAAAAAGCAIESHPHPLHGRDGEVLALDTALDGPAGAERMLVLSSGCHGIEGHCGSGVQAFALHDQEWRDKARAAGVSVLYLHALNPYGFSFGRRVTHENVDLNRNFVDFSKPPPANDGYRQLQPLLLPERWPPDAANQQALADHLAQHGLPATQEAVTRGQYEFPDGLFYGGNAPSWSHQLVRHVLHKHAGTARQIAWIDVHSGLGDAGIGERIFCGRPDDMPAIERARRWWGDKVTSMHDGSSSSAPLTGQMGDAAYDDCPKAEVTSIAIEFGTVPLMDVLNALRAEQWLYLHPGAPRPLATQIHQQMRDAFFTDSDAWKGQVISQARQAMFQAVDGLTG